MLAAAILLAGSLSAYAANRDLADIDRNVVFLAGFALVGAVLSYRRTAARYGAKANKSAGDPSRLPLSPAMATAATLTGRLALASCDCASTGRADRPSSGPARASAAWRTD
jgi:hypothetical protein